MNYDMGEMTPAWRLSEHEARVYRRIYDGWNFRSWQIKLISSAHKEGKPLYESYCVACHGPDSKGMGGMAPDLTKYGSADFVVRGA